MPLRRRMANTSFITGRSAPETFRTAARRAPRLGPAARLAVYEQPLKGTEERHRAPGDPGQLQQVMRSRFSALTATQLLARDRAPQLIEHPRRLLGHRIDRPLEMLAPELQAHLAR